MQSLVQRAQEIHRRLMNPPNAVKDYGIDLKRKKTIPITSVEQVQDVPIIKLTEAVLLAPQISEIDRLESQIKMLTEKLRFMREESEVRRAVPTISVNEIQRIVAVKYNLTRRELLSHHRQHQIVLPRQVAMYLCKKLTINSYPKIGLLFGDRDHTTVLHAVRKIENLRTQDIRLNAEIEQLLSVLTPA